MPEEGMMCEDDDCMDDAERLITYRDGKVEKEEYLCEVHAAPRLKALQDLGMHKIEIVDYDADADEDDDDEEEEEEESEEDGDGESA